MREGGKLDPLANDAPSRLAMFLFLHLRGWRQVDLARALAMSPVQMSRYAQGEVPIQRKLLDRMAEVTGFPVFLVDPVLQVFRSLVAGLKGRFNPNRVVTARALSELTALFLKSVDALRPPAEPRPEGRDSLWNRDEAAALWETLKACTPAELGTLVKELAELQTPAFCERVARASIDEAANDPTRALALAELALSIADRVPGEATFRKRLQGYAGVHLANARRVCNQLPLADETFARAQKLWIAGAGSDSGFLAEAWVPWIEAALRRAQRRLPEALERAQEALALDCGALRGKILITQSGIYDALGQPESSTGTLLEALSLVDPERQPQLALYLRFNLLTDLAQLERHAEVEEKLPEVRALAERLGGDLDLNRLAWLEAKCAAGLKRTAQAEAGFKRVRKAFLDRGLTFDYALVTLELSLLLLEQNRTAEVRRLALEMLRIFQEQEVAREALAAIKVFCDAARTETANVELARRVVRFLYRAQHDPELQFGHQGT